MRTAVFVLLGTAAGVLAGIAAAFAAVLLWYDVFGLGDHGGDGLSGLSSFMALSLLFALAGGVAGAILMARRSGSERAGRPPGAVAAIALLFVLGLAALFVLGLI